MAIDKKKLILVTGAGRGIGREIATGLVRAGYIVSGCSRTKRELDEVKQEFGERVSVSCLDVTNLSALEKWITKESNRSDVIPWSFIGAAGVHGAIGPTIYADWREWKQAVEVNLFANVVASKTFAESLIKRNLAGRILLLSGGGATRAIENMSAYSASKAGMVRFAETLAEELLPYSITVNSLAPGAINTALTQTIIEAGPERAGAELYAKTKKQLTEGGDSVTQVVDLCEFLLKEELGSVTGRLIAAKWDKWQDFQDEDWTDEHQFRLRRITRKGGEF